MSGRKQALSTSLACESEYCSFVAPDGRALAIHTNACPHIQESRDQMILNARQVQQAKRARHFGISNTADSDDDESSESEGHNTNVSAQYMCKI